MTEQEFNELERHFGAIAPEDALQITEENVFASIFGAAAIVLGLVGLFI